ncbi:hypothetical protein pipiens_004299 [Culex pipiens pipiens]|uniref:Cytochrome P450 n=1 Tax=Culex pipiens pipiens TaxID=38569 RepID=A0ABD1CK66_CULPP
MLLELTLLGATILLFIKFKLSYWHRQNVPFIKPRFPYGNFKDAGLISTAELAAKQYNAMKDRAPFFGLYFFLQPLVMITDLDLIKTIFIKDFNFFPDRGAYHNARDDPLSAHLFNIEGNKWRSLRARLTPTFTSGKIRLMFPTLKAVGDNFSEYLTKIVGSGADIEVKDTVARFTMDVIGSCAFGIECNTFEEPDSQFRQLGNKLRTKLLNDDVASFFYKLVADTIAYREANSIERNDFMSLLIALKNQGDLTLVEAAAQSLVFFLAGFETSSSNQTYCLYELALNPQWQEKARSCVLHAMEKHGGLTYEAVNDMKYLDQCINETLRLYPSVPLLERKATQDYQVPNSNVIIPNGMKVHIPIYGIQRDEQYYPDPTVFNPDRFHPEKVAKRHPCTFLSFGEGPRNCIGKRFGMLQSRLGLATVLINFWIL